MSTFDHPFDLDTPPLGILNPQAGRYVGSVQGASLALPWFKIMNLGGAAIFATGSFTGTAHCFFDVAASPAFGNAGHFIAYKDFTAPSVDFEQWISGWGRFRFTSAASADITYAITQ